MLSKNKLGLIFKKNLLGAEITKAAKLKTKQNKKISPKPLIGSDNRKLQR